MQEEQDSRGALLASLETLDSFLSGRTYLVGERVTLAEVTLISDLIPVFDKVSHTSLKGLKTRLPRENPTASIACMLSKSVFFVSNHRSIEQLAADVILYDTAQLYNVGIKQVSALTQLHSMQVLNPQERLNLKHLTRWFSTVTALPQFKAALGTFTLPAGSSSRPGAAASKQRSTCAPKAAVAGVAKRAAGKTAQKPKAAKATAEEAKSLQTGQGAGESSTEHFTRGHTCHKQVCDRMSGNSWMAGSHLANKFAFSDLAWEKQSQSKERDTTSPELRSPSFDAQQWSSGLGLCSVIWTLSALPALVGFVLWSRICFSRKITAFLEPR